MTPTLEIRHAVLDDLVDLRRMVDAFLAGSVYDDLWPDADLPDVLALIEEAFARGPDACRLVAAVDGPVCGLLLVVKQCHPVSYQAFADELLWWVDPRQRNRRVGPALLEAAEDWCRSVDLNMLRMVAPTGSRVGNYLDRQGYRAVETSYVKELDELVRRQRHPQAPDRHHGQRQAGHGDDPPDDDGRPDG